MKILYIPLDERPCNYKFPYQIFNDKEFEVIRPPMEIMGGKKQNANIEALGAWLIENAGFVRGIVLSVDTLIYGGIVPSRIHQHKCEELVIRLKVIEEIKLKYPQLLIYAFQLIMRCPQYNSSDEEPDYYEDYGKAIFRLGYLEHLKAINKITAGEKEELDSINIPKDVLKDYQKRREINLLLNVETLRLVQSGVIDYLSIPQDDSSEFGWTALEQNQIRKAIADKGLLNKVYMYPGADEAGSTVLSRMFCCLNDLQPKVFLKYPSITSGLVIPSLEDRYLDTMVKYQVIVSGGIVVDSLKEADIVLFINAASDKMLSSFFKEKPGPGLTIKRNVIEGIEFLKYSQSLGKAIVIGDVTYGNGSDLEIYQLLVASNLLLDLAGFAGWNTAANSVGSCIAQGFNYLKYKRTKKHLDFLVSRFIEDIGYCGYTRQLIMEEILPNSRFNYFNVGEANGEMAKLVLEKLDKFLKEEMKGIYKVSKINSLQMPWKRMYEIDLDAEYCGIL
ncbi:MAG: DUF4127 family protein [Bacilli bacterium]|nr:DUF4127 family protein [Bacilli bacterium]